MTDMTTTPALAAQIQSWRERRQMTRDQLAARCAELGEPRLTAVVLLNIEGRKTPSGVKFRDITVWELTVLARALEVAPLQLLYPVGLVTEVAVPGPDSVAPMQAAMWFTGEQQYLTDVGDPLGQGWGRGEYHAGERGGDGVWAWYELPGNESGAMADLRRALVELEKWRALVPVADRAAHLMRTAQTPATRDSWSSLYQIIAMEADKHWGLLKVHCAAARRSPVPVSLFNMEHDEQKHADLMALARANETHA